LDKFIIEGGRSLSGQVKVAGAKNAVLPELCAALLVDSGRTVVRNVPGLADVDTMLKVLEHLGVHVERHPGERAVVLDASSLGCDEAPYDLVRKMRASFMVFGPLLSRLGHARVSLPGGCSLGTRPVDLHIKALERMGAEIEEDRGYVVAKAKRLSGADVFFDRPSHTGTENVMLAAVLADGTTRIVNAACDPEVTDLARMLISMGASIEGAGTPLITVRGVRKLHGTEHTAMGDRLEAGTYLCAGAITGGDIEVREAEPEHLKSVLVKLVELGCEVEASKKRIRLRAPKRLSAMSLTTYPFPGFPTDLQPPLLALACVADGTSVVRETVFDERFNHAPELIRLGANIEVAGDRATIVGVKNLTGASVMAPDIRAGAALVLAALAAEGISEVLRVYHVDRGYEGLDERLRSLGAEITRVAV
jgi:UDP-N-acetylglucosamine 1-carboxyvinyltransferase